jgi:hypothetical protein
MRPVGSWAWRGERRGTQALIGWTPANKRRRVMSTAAATTPTTPTIRELPRAADGQEKCADPEGHRVLQKNPAEESMELATIIVDGCAPRPAQICQVRAGVPWRDVKRRFLTYSSPPRSPSPRHLAVLTTSRPCQGCYHPPGTTRIRLPSAPPTSPRQGRRRRSGLPPPLESQRLTAQTDLGTVPWSVATVRMCAYVAGGEAGSGMGGCCGRRPRWPWRVTSARSPDRTSGGRMSPSSMAGFTELVKLILAAAQ